MPAPIVPPMQSERLPAHLYAAPWALGHRLQAAIRLRQDSLDHPWSARQDARCGMRVWLGPIASNIPSMYRRPAEIAADEAREHMTPEPPEEPR